VAQVRGFLQAQKTILKRKKYLALFALATLFFAWLFFFLTSIRGQSLESWLYATRDATKLFILIASPLAGLVLTTQVFVLRNYRFGFHEAKAGGSAVGAFLAGAIATACCSPFVAGALAIIGFAGTNAFLLQYETQVSVIAIAVLAAALYYSSTIVFCEECRVKTNSEIKRR
jgi:hypothetical protein